MPLRSLSKPFQFPASVLFWFKNELDTFFAELPYTTAGDPGVFQKRKKPCKISTFHASKRVSGGESLDEKEFESVYRDYFDLVYRYALALTRDVHAAEELTQETFFKAMQALDRFRGDSSVRTWLCSIAKNAYLSQLRRKQPQPLDELSERPDEEEGPEALALQKEESLRIHRALHALPEPYKEVFSLRVFGQLSFKEIAELFGKTENWACVVYHRARGKLNAKMEESQ